MTSRVRNHRGFTLIELAVVITIASIVAVFVVFFLTSPVQSYFAQSRRVDLVDSGGRILRGVATDVQTALPNSIRSAAVGNVLALELLATTGVTRYYGQGDKSYLAQPQRDLEELAIGQPDTDFYTLDQFRSVAGGQYLAINNPGLPGAYAFGAVMSPSLPTITPNAGTGEEQLHFAGGGFNFAGASPRHHLFLVSGPVSYLCDTNAQTIRRYSSYSVTAVQNVTDAQLMAAGAVSSLVAQHVSACTLSVRPASGSFGQLVILSVTLSNSGETLQVFQEVGAQELP